jgi:Fe-S-cluster-containing hydrogenase component 2/thioredoxin reductase
VVDKYRVAIIGAGPAGLSAAGRAAALDVKAGRTQPSYVLLEAFSAPAKTIQRYQKRKHVMDEPGFLDLRSDLRFGAGERERVLDAWVEDLARLTVNIRLGAEVKKVTGQRGNFQISLSDRSVLEAETLVLAIGLEGNPRKIGARGEELPAVQYQLDDPKEFSNETILVIGAGDSAIENALALAEQNVVWIVNRGKEFTRAKDANLSAVLAAINDSRRRLNCFYETSIQQIAPCPANAARVTVTLQTPTGERQLECDRLIARLGAEAPRRFVESLGIRFPSERRDAIPALSQQYESNVPGIYIIGSLAGYPLIKQAMNQGHDVIEFINGNNIRPADYGLLELQFRGLADERDPEEHLERFRTIVPMFSELNALAFRELIVESDLIVAYAEGPAYEEARTQMESVRAGLAHRARQPRSTRIIREGSVIYEPGEFGTSFFTIVNGEVSVESIGTPSVTTQLGRGEFFGELSLLSGRPRTERAIAGRGCVLVETPRRTMLKLMSSNETLRKGIDWIFVVRELQRHFAPYATLRDLRPLASRVSMRQYRSGDTLFAEGDAADSLFVLRSGNVRLTRGSAGEEMLVAQIRAGQLIGEMALMGDPQRRETARATVASQTLEVMRPEFLALTRREDANLEPLVRDAGRRAIDTARMAVRPEAAALMNFLMDEGLGEATNVLVIDEALCIGCDNCEKACADTHRGVSRLDRKAGASFARVHVPIACRHCEQPHCMKDCPPNAIRRAQSGEVYIDDTCIGCGNCQTNCPYGVVRMEYAAPPKPGLLQWLLLGRGSGPGEEPDYVPTQESKAQGKKAMKCDACVGIAGGPACVSACPTGAAMRIGPERYVDLVEEQRQ